MTPANCVAIAALAAGSIAFLLYCISTISILFTKSAANKTANEAVAKAKSTGDPQAKAASVADFTKLMEALSKLTDSLSKASPSLTSLIGAVLMFAIAAVASGALTTPPAAPNPKDNQSSSKPGPTQPATPGSNSAAP